MAAGGLEAIVRVLRRDPGRHAVHLTQKIGCSSAGACGALAEPHGTLVEPWNPRETLPQPRTTLEPVWAETPKLEAVGEKNKFGSLFFRRLCKVVVFLLDMSAFASAGRGHWNQA